MFVLGEWGAADVVGECVANSITSALQGLIATEDQVFQHLSPFCNPVCSTFANDISNGIETHVKAEMSYKQYFQNTF
jgi:hypothetical protein